jgi:hypothetical protein
MAMDLVSETALPAQKIVSNFQAFAFSIRERHTLNDHLMRYLSVRECFIHSIA